MSADSRLDDLVVNDKSEKYGDMIRIDKIKFTNYKFFYEKFELPVDGQNILLYGENGSGKSSIYKALELLTKKSFIDFDKNRNIFSKDKPVEVEFGFKNGQELIISSDLEEMPDHIDFVSKLSIFKPMLDYKKLLRVHYEHGISGDEINLYEMLSELLKDYPINKDLKTLYEIEDLVEFFSALKTILDTDFKNDINNFLLNYFKADFSIDKFEYKTKREKSGLGATPVVNIIIDYKGCIIEKYHSFLNEARLSALAISLYFVSIKKLLDEIKEKSLKILVLDDLLISLDMNNRIKLLEILKNEFSDFQIFFFTHDKDLFEMYKNKMSWKKYELYLDDSGDIPMPILKEGKSNIERAKQFYAQKEYDVCANLLRKEFEKILKSYLPQVEQRDKNYEPLDLSSLVDKATSKTDGDIKKLLEKLDSDRKHILNPLSHRNDVKVYSNEVKSAIDDLVELKRVLK